jgi:hypothetical protein
VVVDMSSMTLMVVVDMSFPELRIGSP